MQRTLRLLAACRTAALGGHVTRCDHCGAVAYHYHSCGDRHCPQCGGGKRAAWLAQRRAELLPVPYFHVVFTLPHQLSALVLGNRKLLYGLLLEAAAQTVLEVGADPKHLGARLGVLAVLHTWGQQLEHHPHVHCVVAGGGPACRADGTLVQPPRWQSCAPTFFLPVQVLGRVFRGKYLAGLRQARARGELRWAGSTARLAAASVWTQWLSPLYAQDWVVYVKEPFGGPEQVLKYLAGYTHRVALTNRRLVRLEHDRVTLTWKDYADGCQVKEMTLEAVELVRRFGLHVLPAGLVRIRQYGLLAHRGRGQRLAWCRALLAAAGAAGPSSAAATGAAEAVPAPLGPPCWLPALGMLVVLLALGDGRIPAEKVAWAVALLELALAPGRCAACGLGQPQTIWQGSRPTGPELAAVWSWNTS